MSDFALFLFSYSAVALLSFLVLCNTLSIKKTSPYKRTIAPAYALFLNVIWPIGLLATYVAFMRNK